MEEGGHIFGTDVYLESMILPSYNSMILPWEFSVKKNAGWDILVQYLLGSKGVCFGSC